MLPSAVKSREAVGTICSSTIMVKDKACLKLRYEFKEAGKWSNIRVGVFGDCQIPNTSNLLARNVKVSPSKSSKTSVWCPEAINVFTGAS